MEKRAQQKSTAWTSVFTFSSFLMFLTIQNSKAKPTISPQFRITKRIAFVSFSPHGISSIKMKARFSAS